MKAETLKFRLRSWRALRETVLAGGFRAKDAKHAKLDPRLPSAPILNICGLTQSPSDTHHPNIVQRLQDRRDDPNLANWGAAT
jgi:hypothetical protein